MGMHVLAMTEVNLKRMTYQMRHTVRILHPFQWTDVTLVTICGLLAQAKIEASHKDPITLPIMDPKIWTKNFEAIDKYFRGL